MSPSTSLAAWLPIAEGATGARIDWLAPQCAAARDRALGLGIPDTRQEAWRYTSLNRLLEQGFAASAPMAVAPGMAALEGLLIPGLDSYRVVLVNGRLVPELSALDGLPPGLRVGGLRELLETDPQRLRGLLNAVAGPEQPLFAALNTAGLDDGLVLLMERDCQVERPVELVHVSVGVSVGQDQPRLAQPRHLVALGAGSRGRLIERYVSLDQGTSCTNAVVEVSLGRDSVLEHQRVQQESPRGFHLSGLYASLGSGSHYRCRQVGLGASWARTDLVVRFAGERATSELTGLYLAGDRQLMDFHLDVDHRLPRCRSREHFRGILYGRGRAVFDGRVHVAQDAQGSDAAMTNRNLLLSEGAEVDAKPQLEINADDVKCSHGTTVGQLDPEQLFYLRSRGLAAPQARRMLCLGFAAEVLDDLQPAPLREQVLEEVGRSLEQAPLD